MDGFTVRMGTFFLLIGTFLMIMFMASDMAEKTDFDYFFLALMALAAGWMMRGKRAPLPPSGRFSYFQRMREKREEKEKQAAEKKK